MKTYDITTVNKLFHPSYDGKPVAGCPSGLIGGMELNSPQLPTMAAGRKAGETPKLSFAMTMACTRLILVNEAATVKAVGIEGETDPSGILLKTQDKGFDVWAVTRKSNDGTSNTLELCGKPFGTNVVSFYFGLGLSTFLLLHHTSYPNFVKSVKEAIVAKASKNESETALAIAKMSDELVFVVENMVAGTDPTGITAIRTINGEPIDMTGTFDGGDLIAGAFVNSDELDKLSKTRIKAITLESVMYGDAPINTDFVGDLPMKIRDMVSRGKSILLTGPTATGKTQCVREVAEFLGAPLSYIGGSEGLEDQDLIGSMVPDGNGSWKFSDGPLVEAFRNGAKQAQRLEDENALAAKEGKDPAPVAPAILLIDEVNRLQPRFQNIFVSAMNVRPVTMDYYFRNPVTNEELTCPIESLIFIAARNFGSSYIGTNPMDLAFERRFHKKIDVDYLNPDSEIKLLVGRTGIDAKIAKALVKTANDSRNQLTQLRAPIDTDTLLKWAEELAYVQGKGVALTEKIVLDLAKDIVFDIVLERTERGEFDPAGSGIMSDNISESWKEVFGK